MVAQMTDATYVQNYTLSAATLKRLNQLQEQRTADLQKVAQHYQNEANKILLYALEAMGVEGKVVRVDYETGTVVIERQD